ncbi:MAG TPA: thioredoxin domain-containing protein [Kineosporiaceae bacterium]|nr:thioredoxin domain-containing protein [Kineosporiaceae bacterium]
MADGDSRGDSTDSRGGDSTDSGDDSFSEIADPEIRDRVERFLSNPVTHQLGNPDARVCVVEFGDFECPYCAGAAPVLRELVESSEGQVRLVYRNFPLFEVHPHALTAALAAESVAASGGESAYWAMHDKLFAHQARLIDPDLQLYAKAMGGDPDLATGANAQRFAPIVQADYAAGIEVGVSSTPTLFIDGLIYDGRVEVAALRRATGLSTEAAGETRRRPWQWR